MRGQATVTHRYCYASFKLSPPRLLREWEEVYILRGIRTWVESPLALKLARKFASGKSIASPDGHKGLDVSALRHAREHTLSFGFNLVVVKVKIILEVPPTSTAGRRLSFIRRCPALPAIIYRPRPLWPHLATIGRNRSQRLAPLPLPRP